MNFNHNPNLFKALKGKTYKADGFTNDTTDKSIDKSIDKYINLLKAVYSDEWLAVYQYSVEADHLLKLKMLNKISDKVYNQVSKELNIHTQEEFNHGKLLVPELIRLESIVGFKTGPNMDPSKNNLIYHIDSLSGFANDEMLPPDPNSECNEIIIQAITAEENAIKAYKSLIVFTNENDVTNSKFQDTLKFILDQEREHKTDLEKLLKEFKEKK